MTREEREEKEAKDAAEIEAQASTLRTLSAVLDDAEWDALASRVERAGERTSHDGERGPVEEARLLSWWAEHDGTRCLRCRLYPLRDAFAVVDCERREEVKA